MSEIQVARLLGIDVQNEPQYLWIAQQATRAQLESEEWKEFTNEQGKTMYYNVNSKKIQAIHPVIATYSRIYQRQKGFVPPSYSITTPEPSDQKVKFATLLRVLNQRIEDQLPALTPGLLSDLAVLLGVSPQKECQLMRTIQATVDSYVDKKYDLSTLLDDLSDPIASLRNIYAHQVSVAHKPELVIMCQECEKKSAVLRCESACQDVFCQECFDSLHATGNRKSHPSSQVEQLVCVVCDKALATSQCIHCGTFFCEPCFASMHSKPELNAHRKRTVSGLVCQECQQTHAVVVCEDCVDLFCSACYVNLHQNGNRKIHVHATIDPNGQMFKQGLLVEPAQAQSLLDRARLNEHTNSRPWIKFDSDKWEPFWYNLKTEQISTTCP